MPAEYVSVLHNLGQINAVIFTEEQSMEGPKNSPTWNCWIHVQEVRAPLIDLGIPQTFWHSASSRKEARKIASRNVLYAINYYEDQGGDIPTAAALQLAQENTEEQG
ncbi:hypothetical protein FS837_012305 [Tulasnella sp. UAMH 9824]|nr:hypothetical protein FS837_012305 [Tulasnella sp. UAMH 9824]